MDANINKGGRPKKNKKGAGRPSGAYSKLHPGDKAVYHQNKTRVSRGYSPSRSSGRDDSYPRRLNRGRSGEYRREEGDEEVQVKKRGRPQLNPEKGSMDDEALKERKRELWKLDFKKKKIEKLRREAVSARKDRMGAAGDKEDDDITSDDYDDDETNGDDEQQEDGNMPSERTVFRVKAAFFQHLPNQLNNQLEVLRKLSEEFTNEKIKVEKDIVIDGTADRSTIYRYRIKLSNFLLKNKEDYRIEPASILLSWAQKLICKDQKAFYTSGLYFVDQHDIPKEIRVKLISDSLATAMIRERRNPDCRRVSLRHALEVAKAADLHHTNRGDIAALQRGIGATYEFAMKVLKVVDKKGTAEELIRKKVRRDSVKATDVAARLTEFLTNAEHSRALPGHESISVAYNCRKPKFLLKKSKDELLDIFKKENSDILFSHRVLLREWPANFVPPTHKDEMRNVCPLHSNIRRCLDGLRKVGAAANLPKSVRGICSTTICPSPTTVPLVPSTWPQDCALGLCPSCPKITIELPSNLNVSVNFLQWKKGQSSKVDRNGDPKKIFPSFLSM